MMIFLDSDAIIAILRGTPTMGAFLAVHKTELFAIPTPALFEIYYGFYYPPLSKEFQQNARFLQRLQGEQQRLLQLLNDTRYKLGQMLPRVTGSSPTSAAALRTRVMGDTVRRCHENILV